jgi:predicted permease
MQLRLALRTLWAAPFVTAVAVLSLALGIGANTAIFSLFNQLILRPLPVPSPEQLVNLSAPPPKPGSTSCNTAGPCADVFSYAMFRDLERHQTVFTGIAAHRLFEANLAFEGQSMNGEVMLVSGSYFPVLGLQPTVGRLIDASDDRVIGESPVVVLSHGYWQTRFGADPTVVGRTLTVNGQALTITGVAPAGFQGTTLGAQPEVFVPVTLRGLMTPGFTGWDDRRTYWAYLFARLKPGVSLVQARAGVNPIYRSILQDVEVPLQQAMSDETMARFRAKPLVVEPGARGQSSIPREARPALILLLAVTGVVLLIACANIANLLLVRAVARTGEVAVRLSLGATRQAIGAQLLAESCLLGALGGGAGILAARWTLNIIVSLLPAEASGTISQQIDLAALGFTAALALGTGMLFGLFPALHSARTDLASALKGQAGQPSGARAAARFRTTLATAQVALSMAALVGAGLLTRSLVNVTRIDLGLNVEKLVTFGVAPELNGYTPAQSRVLFQRLEEELAALPGVARVTASLVPALSGSNWGSNVLVEGFEAGPDTDTNARYNEVGAGYFTTMGIAVLAGREFARSDGPGGPKVAIVNERFTRKFALGRDAVGKRMATAGPPGATLDTEIVGVVADAKYSEVKAEVPPLFFRPYLQDDRLGAIFFYVRTSLDTEALIANIPQVVARLDPNLPVRDLRTMAAQVRENVFLDRTITTLAAAFALLAAVLAALGLYGVLAYTVAQRVREIGVRMALGATPRQVSRMVIGQAAKMTLVGGASGLGGGFGLGRLGQSLLFEIEGLDPIVMLGAAAGLALVAFGAAILPARQASSIDPMRALRYE